MSYKDFITEVPNFPKDGIGFKDISPLLKDQGAFRSAIVSMGDLTIGENKPPDVWIGIDARGFLFCTLVAEQLGLGALMIRKPNKLPGELIEKKYELEYGTNSLSIQKLNLENKSIVIIDDLLATGGSMQCSKELLESLGANVVGGAVVIELTSLKGSSQLYMQIISLISYAD